VRLTCGWVHHACCPSDAQHALWVLRQHTTHWDEAVLLLFNVLHLCTAQHSGARSTALRRQMSFVAGQLCNQEAFLQAPVQAPASNLIPAASQIICSAPCMIRRSLQQHALFQCCRYPRLVASSPCYHICSLTSSPCTCALLRFHSTFTSFQCCHPGLCLCPPTEHEYWPSCSCGDAQVAKIRAKINTAKKEAAEAERKETCPSPP
jgi:hypothetical protein